MILIWAILWVLAATVVAFLPMRFQFVPGLALLIMAPVLIFRLGGEFGWIIGIAALAAFISMYRKPLHYYFVRWRAMIFKGDKKEPE